MKKVFLICSERSGSNLITQLINRHSRCMGKSPTHLYRLFLSKLNDFGNLMIDENWIRLITEIVKGFNLKIGQDWSIDITRDEILKNVEFRNPVGVLDYIYEKEAMYHNKDIVFIKEVKTYKLVPALIKYYPDALFLFQYRDPRDMCLSWHKSPVHRGDLARSAAVWNEDQLNSLIVLKTLSAFGLVHAHSYESLIHDPDLVLESFFSFIDVKYENDSLINLSSNQSNLISSSSESWKNLNKDILSKNSKKYREKLTSNQIKYIEYVCSVPMSHLNFDFEYNPISKEEFNLIKLDILKSERFTKPEYETTVSQFEKERRSQWMSFYKTQLPDKLL